MKKHIRKFISSQSKYQRDKKISLLKPFFHPEKMVLDVGVWSNFPEPNPSENWLEKKYSQDVQIVAVGLDDMRDFKKNTPMLFVFRPVAALSLLKKMLLLLVFLMLCLSMLKYKVN